MLDTCNQCGHNILLLLNLVSLYFTTNIVTIIKDQAGSLLANRAYTAVLTATDQGHDIQSDTTELSIVTFSRRNVLPTILAMSLDEFLDLKALLRYVIFLLYTCLTDRIIDSNDLFKKRQICREKNGWLQAQLLPLA